ncbi:MAG TPA: P-II family nitrogen regulator [Xanthobacteraceae bacterium]|nr:P-II family nitrogen regulator [Xanthobacteraceae bacterium]
MKLVIAVVKPFKLDNVVDALKRAGARSLTAFEVKDFDQKGPTEIYRGAQYTANFLPMVRVEAALASDQVATVTAAVAAAAETGRPGDVKLFVIDAEDAARLHAGEPGGITPRRAA